MKNITLLLLLTLNITMQGQTFQWLNTPSIPEDVNIYATSYIAAADPEGNVYFSGFKDSPLLWNDIMGNVYFNKYDTEGQLLFSKSFTGKCITNNMISDSEGNIIMALTYKETLTIGSLTLTAIWDDLKRVLIKLDTDGNLLWHKELYMDGFDLGIIEDFRAIAVDAQNNIYAGYDNYMYSRITKYSPDGENLFTIEQQNVNRITSVAVDTEGNIYSAGACAGQFSSYAGIDVPTDFSYNTYIAKYSPQGQYQWVKYIEDITCPEPRVVARTPDEVYFSSYLFTENNFDDIIIEGPGNGFEDIFIAKLNSNGTFQWVREAYGTGKASPGLKNNLSLDNAGNIYFAGATGGTVNWGNDISTAISSFDNEALILKYSPDGETLFAKTAGGTAEDRMDGICITPQGDIFVTGIGSGNGQFDEIEHPADEFTYYPFLAKISQEILGNDEYAKQIVLYPNPASDVIFVSGIESLLGATIFNMLGQKIMIIDNLQAGLINISNLSPGTYILKAYGHKSIKLIIK